MLEHYENEPPQPVKEVQMIIIDVSNMNEPLICLLQIMQRWEGPEKVKMFL